jgi:glycine/D-amino acid oxidase-like deaminating enzyme
VVIGGGIVGVAATAHLAAAGASVSLVERSAIAAGASGRNSGVVQHPFDPVLRELYLETVAIYRELSVDPALDFRVPVEPAGLLLVALAEPGPRRLAAELRSHWPELATEFLAPSDLRRLEPALAPEVSACRVGIGYPVPPAAPTRGLAALAERSGAQVLVGHEVAGLERSGERTVGVRLADGTTIQAGSVLVTAGPWSPELVDPSGRWRPIRPFWGVVVEAALRHPPSHVLEEAEMDEALGEVAPASPSRASTTAKLSATPAAPSARVGSDPLDGPDDAGDRPEFSLVTAAGRTSLGSTFLDREPDPASWIPRLVARGRRFVPALAHARLGPVRACARPLAADGRPLLGAIPGRPGVFIAAGHGPWGISTGPASGRLVADLILGRPVDIPPELQADRFGQPDQPFTTADAGPTVAR